MKAVIREHIQQLDVEQGGGIVSDKIRVGTIDNPMLVIGLGGTGIDALLRLKYQINRRFQLPEDPITKKRSDKPDNIEFLAFETNEHDKNKKYKGIGLDQLSEFVLLSNAEVGSLLQDRTQLEPYITDWLSPELLITDGISGASGIRQAGRLLLFTKINQVVQALDKKIRSLVQGTNKKLTVFLLTGVSGGTGSGCFLDISYIVRGIVEREYGNAGVDKVNMLGYIFMPDVNLSNNSLTEHTKEYIKKNGYAGLKELDYWMNVEERGERFKQQYGNALTVQSPMPPFNLAHLISATNLEGKLLDNAYDYCMNVTAENITNFMASEDKSSGEEFAIHDYISNIRTNINQMPRPFAANYKYNILGASSAVLPIEEITTYLAYRLFKKMEGMFQSSPGKEDVDQVVRKMGLDIDSVRSVFQSQVAEPIPGYQNNDLYNYDNVVKNQIINIDSELKDNFLTRAREQYIKTRKQYPDTVIEKFNEQLSRIFKNPQQGPFFANRIITSRSGYAIMNQISAYIEVLKEEQTYKNDSIEDQKRVALQRFGDAKSAFISKTSKKDTYIAAKIEEYLIRADQLCNEEIIDFYEDVLGQISEINSRIYDVFTELLEVLNSIFDKNAQILLNGDEQVDHKGNKTYYWNIVSVPDVESTVAKVLEEKSAEDMIRQFTFNMMEQSHFWIKEQDVDIVNAISQFLSNQFGELITKSMEEFIQIKFGNDETVDKIIERIIAKRLDDDAIPVFHLNNSSGGLNFPSAGFVSVPADAANIFKGVKDYQRTALANSKFTIKESKVRNRIFWLNTKNGIPLFSYSPIKNYEQSYENSILEQDGIGRHLVQTKNKNWTYLPSPIPERTWGEIYENKRVKEYNESVRKLFDQAVNLKIIVEKGVNETTTSRYEVILTEPFDIKQFMTNYHIQRDDQKVNFAEVTRCLANLKQMFNEGINRVQTKDIFFSTTLEFAKENLIRTPELITVVRQEVEKYEAINSKIEELSVLTEQFKAEMDKTRLFIEALYTEVVYKKGVQFVYDHDSNESSWEPFINLLQVSNHPEYELYKKVSGLDKQRKEILERKIALRREQFADNEGLVIVSTRLKSWFEAFQKGKEQLDYTRQDFADGEEKYQFYLTMMAEVSKLISNLE